MPFPLKRTGETVVLLLALILSLSLSSPSWAHSNSRNDLPVKRSFATTGSVSSSDSEADHVLLLFQNYLNLAQPEDGPVVQNVETFMLEHEINTATFALNPTDYHRVLNELKNLWPSAPMAAWQLQGNLQTYWESEWGEKIRDYSGDIAASGKWTVAAMGAVMFIDIRKGPWSAPYYLHNIRQVLMDTFMIGSLSVAAPYAAINASQYTATKLTAQLTKDFYNKHQILPPPALMVEMTQSESQSQRKMRQTLDELTTLGVGMGVTWAASAMGVVERTSSAIKWGSNTLGKIFKQTLLLSLIFSGVESGANNIRNSLNQAALHEEFGRLIQELADLKQSGDIDSHHFFVTANELYQHAIKVDHFLNKDIEDIFVRHAQALRGIFELHENPNLRTRLYPEDELEKITSALERRHQNELSQIELVTQKKCSALTSKVRTQEELERDLRDLFLDGQYCEGSEPLNQQVVAFFKGFDTPIAEHFARQLEAKKFRKSLFLN